MNLKEQTIHGLSWSALSQVVKQLNAFIITAILARLLRPSDFGLIGMATVFTQFAAVVGESGFTGALIQKQHLGDEHYSTVFWLNIVAGFLLMFGMAITAPFIAQFYSNPALIPVLRAISISFLLASFGVVQQALLMKSMNFKSLMIRDIAAMSAGGITGIALAASGFGVWSLVGQLLVFTLADAIALWSSSSWRPKFVFSKNAALEIFSFSAHLMGFNVTNYIARNTDYLLIGKFLGSESLGLYTLAYKLMLVPLQNVSWVVSRVMFPAFSKIQHDLDVVRKSYLKLVKIISLVTFPMMAGLCVLAPETVRVFFGARWSGAIVPIQIFCFCGMVQSLTTIGGIIYQSQGRPDIQFKMSLANTALTVIVILISLRWGIVGVAAGYTLFTVLWSHLSFYIASRLIQLPYLKLYGQILASLALCFVLMAEMLAVKHFLASSDIKIMAVITVVGLSSYFGLLLSMQQINWNGHRFSIAVN